MNTVSQNTKLQIVSDLLSQGLVKSSKEFKAAYKKRYKAAWFQLNKEYVNRDNRERYHRKYKQDAQYRESKKALWQNWKASKTKEQLKARNKKYRRPWSKLSPLERSKQIAAVKRWGLKNKKTLAAYARKFRHKRDPSIPVRNAIRDAKRTGDLGKLIEACLSAITRIDDKSSRGKGDT